MKVLVTGADGFIGSHLTELLVEKGLAGHALPVRDGACRGLYRRHPRPQRRP